MQELEYEQREFNFQGHYRKGALYRAIESNAISHKGNAFSVLLRIKKYEVKYEYVNRILFWSWREFERTPCPDYSAFEEDRTYWDDHGLCGLNYLYHSFTRTSSESGKYKKIDEFVNVTVEVSETLSKQIYEETILNANKFKEYLLTQGRNALSLATSKLNSWHKLFSPSQYLCVSIDGIYSVSWASYSDDRTPTSHQPETEFINLGLKKLDSIASCYGLAMAIIEYYGYFDKYEYTLDLISIRTHSHYLDSSVRIRRSERKQSVSLADW